MKGSGGAGGESGGVRCCSVTVKRHDLFKAWLGYHHS